MEFCSGVLDNKETECILYTIYIIRSILYTKRGGSAGAVRCRCKVFAFIVLYGQLAILFPQAPYAVGTEGLVGKSEALCFCVVVYNLILAICLC